MAYHINFNGEVGECTAQYACPFGDFDTEHFTTREQAQYAYELSMEGKAVAPALSRDVYFDRLNDVEAAKVKSETKLQEEQRKHDESLRRDKEKRDRAYTRWLESLKVPETRIPPLGEPGYFKTVRGPQEVGEEFQGGTVTGLDYFPPPNLGTPQTVTVEWKTEETAGAVMRRQEFLLEDFEERQVWVPDEYAPEILAVREAALRERAAEDFALNYINLSSDLRYRLRTLEDRTFAAREVAAKLRIFKRKAKEFKKSGLSNPYTRALAYAQMPGVTGQEYTGSNETVINGALRCLVTGERNGTSQGGARSIAEELFDPGEAPYVDVFPDAVLEEREKLGLA